MRRQPETYKLTQGSNRSHASSGSFAPDPQRQLEHSKDCLRRLQAMHHDDGNDDAGYSSRVEHAFSHNPYVHHHGRRERARRRAAELPTSCRERGGRERREEKCVKLASAVAIESTSRSSL